METKPKIIGWKPTTNIIEKLLRGYFNSNYWNDGMLLYCKIYSTAELETIKLLCDPIYAPDPEKEERERVDKIVTRFTDHKTDINEFIDELIKWKNESGNLTTDLFEEGKSVYDEPLKELGFEIHHCSNPKGENLYSKKFGDASIIVEAWPINAAKEIIRSFAALTMAYQSQLKSEPVTITDEEIFNKAEQVFGHSAGLYSMVIHVVRWALERSKG